MQTQVLEPWSPAPQTEGEWSLTTVFDTPEGLTVCLDRGTKSDDSLVIKFGWVPAYRVSPAYIYNYSPEGGSLRVAVDSEYLAWLRQATDGVQDQACRHYVILTVDATIDVLCPAEPHVSVEQSLA